MLAFSTYVLFVDGEGVFEGTKKECLKESFNHLGKKYDIEHQHYEC